MIIVAKLAMEGGEPVRTKTFPDVSNASGRDIGAEELAEITEVIRSGCLWRMGGTNKVIQLEKEFSQFMGVKHGVASTSGTAAIHVAVGAINPDPGDEIITAPITDMGTIIPIVYQNCIPVFADIDPNTYSMLPNDLESKISDRTRAVIVVHLFGQCNDMDPIVAICRKHNLYLIEDCSQAYLAEYKGIISGTMGDLGAYSMQQSKHMTTGDGGMTITDNDELGYRARLFADKGWPRDEGVRDHLFLGPNYRMTGLQGAVALAQLKKLRSVVERRRRAADMLTELIKQIPGVNPPAMVDGAVHSWWLYPFTIDEEVLGVSTDEFASAVAKEGIPASSRYIGVPMFLYRMVREKVSYGSSHCPWDCPRYGKVIEYKEGQCPGAEQALREMILLPCNEFFTERDVKDIAEGLDKVADHYRSKNSGKR